MIHENSYRVFYKKDGTLIYEVIEKHQFIKLLDSSKIDPVELKDWIMLKTPLNTFIYWKDNIVDSDTLILDLAISQVLEIQKTDRICVPFPFNSIKSN